MAKLLLGKEVTDALNANLQTRTAALREKGINPTLGIIRVGANPSDLSYEKGATARAALVGVDVKKFELAEDATKEEVAAVIDQVNADDTIHGVLMFQPFPKHLRAYQSELCNRLGWDYKEVAIDWNSKDSELSSGNINCIWNGFTCTGREDQYPWSDAYVDNSIVLVVKKDSGIASMADLAGKTVMAQAASSAADAINGNEAFKSSLKEVIELADYNTGFMELKQGTVDAIAADQGIDAKASTFADG